MSDSLFCDAFLTCSTCQTLYPKDDLICPQCRQQAMRFQENQPLIPASYDGSLIDQSTMV